MSPEFAAFGGITDGDRRRSMLQRLLEQQFGIVARSQTDQADMVGQIFRHLDGAGADGAGRAEKNNVFHTVDLRSTRGANTNTSAAH